MKSLLEISLLFIEGNFFRHEGEAVYVIKCAKSFVARVWPEAALGTTPPPPNKKNGNSVISKKKYEGEKVSLGHIIDV